MQNSHKDTQFCNTRHIKQLIKKVLSSALQKHLLLYLQSLTTKHSKEISRNEMDSKF